MHLTYLSLTNFRNFVRLEKDFPVGPTLLVGDNAQGKTSLLEAVYYLTGASSPHTTSDRQVINFLALKETLPFARIVAELRRADRLQRIEIRVILENARGTGEGRLRKEVLLNGVKRKVRDLAGVFNAVMFLPQNLNVIEGPPGERRRFLDSILSQADPIYAETLSDYGNVLSQRNALLKQLQERNSNADELAFWDDQLCDLAATLIRSRALALDELENLASPILQDLTRGKETLRLDYLPAYDPSPHPDGQLGLQLETPVNRKGIGREAIRSGMLTALERSRQEEIARGMTLIGPHRDDFSFRVNGIDLRLYGSRGQSRTAMLATQLAEVDWLQMRTNEFPILLLLARVDASEQAILTAADLKMFNDEFLDKATIWQISAGTVTPRTM
jgi:DNA replication and repair protein RecF